MKTINKVMISSLILINFTLFGCGNNNSQKDVENNKENVLSLSNNPLNVNFDANNAYKHIEKQLSFGPRVPNSPAANNCKQFLVEELKKYTNDVSTQDFTLNIKGTKLNLSNIIAKFNPDCKKRIILCAHWDTRPWADEDPNPANHNKPIPAANDGASGVGVLLEIARLIPQLNLNYGVDIIFFDGEDYGGKNDLENYCLGSQYFATSLESPEIYKYAILLDMVGDKEAIFKKEKYSMFYAPDFTNLVWQRAKDLNSSCFVDDESMEIIDDHLPLNRVGIKAIDIIDASLIGHQDDNPRRKYWHTMKDDISNISKETLNQVGTLLLNVLHNLNF